MANLEPVHGISFQDWAEMSKVISSGVAAETVYAAMGIDGAVWDELTAIWSRRMAEDTSFQMSALFGQYWEKEVANPKLKNIRPNVSPEGKENLEKLRTDRYFYEELSAARDSAYGHGLDGAQWILDNYGINLGDFQTIAMQYMTRRTSGEERAEETREFLNYREEKKKEYDERFSRDAGGNIADDVEF
ncbi:MAG: hypothetical protein LBC37_05290 [Zoogloeaceae bacterium]|jgi:hypothetical protein|nr:hypothetical protein [Zoogloeaceae bacterium]